MKNCLRTWSLLPVLLFSTLAASPAITWRATPTERAKNKLEAKSDRYHIEVTGPVGEGLGGLQKYDIAITTPWPTGAPQDDESTTDFIIPSIP